MFAIHGHLLPTARSFEAVKKLYDTLPVIADEARGLKDKRDWTKRLIKVGDSYGFVFHSTALVTWGENRIITKCYDSQSSQIFADRFLPSEIDAVNSGGELYYRLDGKYYMQANSRGLVFNLVDGRWQVDPSTAATFTKKVLDKPRAARVRKMIKPFIDWMKTVDRLIGEPELQNNNHHAALQALKSRVVEDAIPTSAYKELSVYSLFRGPSCLPRLYVFTGCVDTVDLPLGSLRAKSKYDGV